MKKKPIALILIIWSFQIGMDKVVLSPQANITEFYPVDLRNSNLTISFHIPSSVTADQLRIKLFNTRSQLLCDFTTSNPCNEPYQTPSLQGFSSWNKGEMKIHTFQIPAVSTNQIQNISFFKLT